MTKEFQLKARNIQGYEVLLTGTYPEDYEETLVDLIAKEMAPIHAIPVPVAIARAGAVGNNPASLSCQICSGRIEAVKFGKIDQSAEEVAEKRSDKMVKMGEAAGGVCGKCWKQKGFADEWDRGYKAGQWK